MHDDQWNQLVVQICDEYPTFTVDEVVRHVTDAAAGMEFFGLGITGIARARAMVRHALDEIALQRAAATVPAVIGEDHDLLPAG